MASSSAVTPHLDFEKLLSRDFRPSRISRLTIREAYHPDALVNNSNKEKNHHYRHCHRAGVSLSQQNKQFILNDAARSTQRQETSRLVLSLVSHTPNFLIHLPPEEREISQQATRSLLLTQPPPPRPVSPIPSQYHEVELGDWESKIDWGDGKALNNMLGSEQNNLNPSEPLNPMELLTKKRNPFLDSLVFDETNICLDGSNVEELQRKCQNAPLILELGVAGQSVARHVYQNTVLSAQRPTSALKSDAYVARLERDWSAQPITSTAEVSANAATHMLMMSKSSLHADKDKVEALIEARQRKRAEMAKDKTSRVTQAMGTLALGGGRGRTITSSLMGPGGTERTGRPNKVNSLGGYENEYIEQLDLVYSHSLVRDLSKPMLREFHRPKLPLNVVRLDLAWQFQVRLVQNKASNSVITVGGVNDGYQNAIIGNGSHPGAVSNSKIRVEADLSPGEGKLILLEYFEERPLLQLGKGMSSRIVNYYRGDRSRCPVSKGGGDRPARRKRQGDNTDSESGANRKSSTRTELTRFEGPKDTSIMDWIGKLPKKQRDREQKEAIDILPEGVTEILHPKVHGPFIGEIEEGTTMSGLISNLFVAPIFRHEPEQTDFLMILTSPGGAARPGMREAMGVILRDLPTSVFAVGQIEPRTRVYAPNTQGEKNFIGPFISYQIAKMLTRSEARDGHGLRFDELQDRVLPNLEVAANSLRQRLKQVAVYDKNTQIWSTKSIGYEDYPGVDALSKSISPESVVAFETATAATRRLADLGIHQLCTGSHTIASVGIVMVYLAGQVNAARELSRKAKKLLELRRANKTTTPDQIQFYEKASEELDSVYKIKRLKYDVAQFVYEELQLTPWHLTAEYIDVHKKGEGTGMLKLTGLGDPSGTGEGFSFLREVEKPAIAVGPNPALNNQIKKITGTEDDLRKLTMKQMASLLRSYGMAQKQIDTLKRWDRVHVIRDLSTKAASDGIGDGLERFARGEKMKLSEQKQMYRDRIQTIWGRQIASLSSDAVDKSGASGIDTGGLSGGRETEAAGSNAGAPKKTDSDKESSDVSDSDSDDDLVAALEDEMMDRVEANQLVAAHSGGSGIGGASHLRAATQDQDIRTEARELAALKRQREEYRAAQEGFQAPRPSVDGFSSTDVAKRKVIKRIIRKTYPDGRQTTTFKFILQPEDVGNIISLKASEEVRPRSNEFNYTHGIDEKPPGHSMFEDEDDFDYSSKGRLMSSRLRGSSKRRSGSGGRTGLLNKPRNLQIGKLKTKVSKEERMRKRKREAEELEVYVTTAKRKGANNRRRERGSIRERRPHVMFAEKLESIRASAEARPMSGPFLKPVNRRLLARYYEVISHPIDLSTIRDKISRYEYRTANAFIRDFDLMKTNAIKFNGQATPIAQEAVSMHEFVRDKVNSMRPELASLEEQVDELMNAKPKKNLKIGVSTNQSGIKSSNLASVGGVSVNLGDLSKNMAFDNVESDSDDESVELD